MKRMPWVYEPDELDGPILVEFRCGESLGPRTCGAFVAVIEPDTGWVDDTRTTRERKWDRLTLVVNETRPMHGRGKWSHDVGLRPEDSLTASEFKKYRADRGLSVPRISHGGWSGYLVEEMPPVIDAVCHKDKHRHLDVTAELVHDAVSEWRRTRKRITRAVTRRR